MHGRRPRGGKAAPAATRSVEDVRAHTAALAAGSTAAAAARPAAAPRVVSADALLLETLSLGAAGAAGDAAAAAGAPPRRNKSNSPTKVRCRRRPWAMRLSALYTRAMRRGAPQLGGALCHRRGARAAPPRTQLPRRAPRGRAACRPPRPAGTARRPRRAHARLHTHAFAPHTHAH
jgi:hypothetical protein